ncbi:MAG: hypothetical protein ABS879_02340 [Eubacteriales bacterium]
MSGPRIVFCSNNHIYDASLYDACPYCSKIEAERKEIGAPDTGFSGEPVDIFGPSGADDDPYGATVAGTGPAPTGGSDPFGEPFGGAASGSFFSDDMTLKGDSRPFESLEGTAKRDDGPEAETFFGTENPASEAASGADSPWEETSPGADNSEAETGGSRSAEGFPGEALQNAPESESDVFQNAPESGLEFVPSDGGAESEPSDEEDIPEFKIPFFTKDGVPDPRNIDTSMGLAESMNGSSSGEDKESPEESEEAVKSPEADGEAGKSPEAGEEAEKSPEEEEAAAKSSDRGEEAVIKDPVQKDTDDPAASTIPSQPLGETLKGSNQPAQRGPVFGDSDQSARKESFSAASSQETAGGYWESDDSYEEEDEWESFPLKNEGPVRGWFVLQNGIQKDHSIELCRKSMFIYDYEGMCLIFSRQMENMTLLATIEQYKAISILPEPGVPFKVNGEARRSCGRLGAYMKLLIGSHQVVYVPIDDRLLNGER